MASTVKKIIPAIAFITTMLFGDESNAATVAAEAMAGQESATLDVVVSGELAPRTGIFMRNIATIDYRNNVRDFGLIDISYSVVGGLGLVGETQFSTETGVTPRTGIQYFHQWGDLSLYLLSTVSLERNPTLENVVTLKYRPELGNGVKLYAALDNVTNVAKSHKFSFQRARLGVDINGFQFGAAANFSEIGNKPKFGYNLGAFLRKEF